MKCYPKYKDSGVPWLGHVPSHWPLVRYKYVFNERVLRKDSPLPAGAISYGKVVLKDDDAMHVATKASYQEVLKGDFLVNPINLNYDLKSLRTALSEIDVCVSPAYIVLRPSIEADSSYLKHQLYVFDVSHMKTLGAGVRQTISFKDIGNCWTVIPPRDEQAAISSYLDDEVNRIDAAISSQERMIELLKERRSTIITQAVTKGLDLKAKMKDSGVPWLGQVPAHWDVKRLRHLGVLTSSGIDKVSKEGEQTVSMINFVDVFNSKTKRLRRGDFELMTTTAPADKASIHQVRRGDILITPSSEESSDIGRSALVDDDFSNTVYSYHLLRYSCTSRDVSPQFLSHVLNSSAALSQLSYVAQGTTRQTLSRGDIKDVCVALPQIEEQLCIAAFLDRSIENFNHAISSQERMIELLKERRSAIITQAVTGQLDVR